MLLVLDRVTVQRENLQLLELRQDLQALQALNLVADDNLVRDQNVVRHKHNNHARMARAACRSCTSRW